MADPRYEIAELMLNDFLIESTNNKKVKVKITPEVIRERGIAIYGYKVKETDKESYRQFTLSELLESLLKQQENVAQDKAKSNLLKQRMVILLSAILTSDNGKAYLYGLDEFVANNPVLPLSMSKQTPIVQAYFDLMKENTVGHNAIAKAVIQNRQAIQFAREVKDRKLANDALNIDVLMPYAMVNFTPEQINRSLSNESKIVKRIVREVAKDINHHCYAMLANLPLEQLHHQKWIKKPEEAKELKEMMSWFNGLSQSIVSDIVLSDSKDEVKSKVTFYINLMEQLLKDNNFQAAMTVYGALINGAVSRLSEAFINDDDMSHARKIFEQCAVTLDPKGSSKAVREKMKSVIKVGKPFVPPMQVYISDLTNVDEGNDVNVGIIGKTIGAVAQAKERAVARLKRVDVRSDKTTFISYLRERKLSEKEADERSNQIKARGKEAELFAKSPPESADQFLARKRAEAAPAPAIPVPAKPHAASTSSKEHNKFTLDFIKKPSAAGMAQVMGLQQSGDKAEYNKLIEAFKHKGAAYSFIADVAAKQFYARKHMNKIEKLIYRIIDSEVTKQVRADFQKLDAAQQKDVVAKLVEMRANADPKMKRHLGYLYKALAHPSASIDRLNKAKSARRVEAFKGKVKGKKHKAKRMFSKRKALSAVDKKLQDTINTMTGSQGQQFKWEPRYDESGKLGQFVTQPLSAKERDELLKDPIIKSLAADLGFKQVRRRVIKTDPTRPYRLLITVDQAKAYQTVKARNVAILKKGPPQKAAPQLFQLSSDPAFARRTVEAHVEREIKPRLERFLQITEISFGSNELLKAILLNIHKLESLRTHKDPDISALAVAEYSKVKALVEAAERTLAKHKIDKSGLTLEQVQKIPAMDKHLARIKQAATMPAPVMAAAPVPSSAQRQQANIQATPPSPPSRRSPLPVPPAAAKAPGSVAQQSGGQPLPAGQTARPKPGTVVPPTVSPYGRVPINTPPAQKESPYGQLPNPQQLAEMRKQAQKRKYPDSSPPSPPAKSARQDAAAPAPSQYGAIPKMVNQNAVMPDFKAKNDHPFRQFLDAVAGIEIPISSRDFTVSAAATNLRNVVSRLITSDFQPLVNDKTEVIKARVEKLRNSVEAQAAPAKDAAKKVYTDFLSAFDGLVNRFMPKLMSTKPDKRKSGVINLQHNAPTMPSVEAIADAIIGEHEAQSGDYPYLMHEFEHFRKGIAELKAKAMSEPEPLQRMEKFIKLFKEGVSADAVANLKMYEYLNKQLKAQNYHSDTIEGVIANLREKKLNAQTSKAAQQGPNKR